jgi:hypothetical protein
MKHTNLLKLGRTGELQPINLRVPEEVWTDNWGHFAVDMDMQKKCAKCGKHTRKCARSVQLEYTFTVLMHSMDLISSLTQVS